MDLRLKESSDWRQCAIVEVSDRTTDFFQFIRDDTLRYRVQQAKHAPTGYHWYEIYVDTSDGTRRFARTGWALLTDLKKSADDGLLEGFRIVSGAHWLAIGSDDVVAEASGNMAQG